jgi:hypothetical protein
MSAAMPRKTKAQPRPERVYLSDRITVRLRPETVEQLYQVLSRSQYGKAAEVARHAIELGLAELLRRGDR